MALSAIGGSTTYRVPTGAAAASDETTESAAVRQREAQSGHESAVPTSVPVDTTKAKFFDIKA